MENFRERYARLKGQYDLKVSRIGELARESDYYNEVAQQYILRSNSLQYLKLISEDSTKQLRDYLESIINATLDLIFGVNKYKFAMVYKSKTRKVNLNLLEYANGQWNELNISHQAGDGMGQIIAYIFSIVVTEVTNRRMLFIQDEVLAGLHFKSVEMVQRCIKEFVKHGAQFVQIEYTFNDYGTVIDLERDETQGVTKIVGRTDYGIDFNAEKVKEHLSSLESSSSKPTV